MKFWKAFGLFAIALLGLFWSPSFAQGVEYGELKEAERQVFWLGNNHVKCSVTFKDGKLVLDRPEARPQWSSRFRTESLAVETDADFVLDVMCYIDFSKIREGLSWENRLTKIKKKPSLKIAGNKEDIRKDLDLDEIVMKSRCFRELLVSLYHSVDRNKSRLTIDWDVFRIFSRVVRKIETMENVELKKLFSNVLLQEQYTTAHKRLKGIYILNVHQAKGKEFDWVILPDVTESTFPSDNDDKKKLFYVAVTRARRKVVIYARNNQSKILDIFCFS